jgi:hypothetical protein
LFSELDLHINASLCPNSKEGKKYFTRVARLHIIVNACEETEITIKYFFEFYLYNLTALEL